MTTKNKNKNLKGLQLISRYSLPPNSLGYCGRGTAPEKFKKCIKSGVCTNVGEEIEKFIVLHPYLKTISKITNKPKLSHEVAEAYWLGNDELKKAHIEHYNILLDNLLKQGVPEFFVNELKENKPAEFIPTHLFQVLHVGVGKSSGAVPFNMDSINNCMIRWGKVLELKKIKNRSFMKVQLNSLKEKRGKYELTQVTEKLEYSIDILGSVKEGDIVTVHWKIPNKILTKAELENLEKWTNKTLKSINRSNRKVLKEKDKSLTS